jgi:hypothetical protein
MRSYEKRGAEGLFFKYASNIYPALKGIESKIGVCDVGTPQWFKYIRRINRGDDS